MIPTRMTRILRLLLVAGALSYVAVYVPVALPRMRYPFELEWTEGWMGEHVLRVLRGQSIYITVLFCPLLAGGMIPASWIGKWSVGGDNNAVFPAYAAVALLFRVGFPRLVDRAKRAGRDAQFPEALLHLLCILQFGLLVYNPIARIPTRADEEAGRRLVDIMRNTDGEVWLTFHGYLPTRAGKRCYALSNDYIHPGVTTQAQLGMQAEIREAIQKQ